jgi:hypothetical protein
VPERDSSLYDCFPSSQSQQGYNTFRPLNRHSPSGISVPNLASTTNPRRNSNSSSNEADEESSLSSLNSNNQLQTSNQISVEENGTTIYMTPSLSINSTSMSTFKTTTTTTLITNPLPSKPSDIKRRSNSRKQIYATLNSNNNNNSSSILGENDNYGPPPPPPPPFPLNFDLPNKVERPSSSTLLKQSKSVPLTATSDFQVQIEQARIRLKKANDQTSAKKPVSGVVIKALHPRKLTTSVL